MFEAEAIVDDAAKWADGLLACTYRGHGDTIEAATYRAEQKYGVPAQTFWALRYRRPKDLMASVYLRLKCAYEHECQRQEARLRHELALTKEILGDAASASPAVEQAEALLGASDQRGSGVSPLGRRIMALKRLRAAAPMKFWRLTVAINALVRTTNQGD